VDTASASYTLGVQFPDDDGLWFRLGVRRVRRKLRELPRVHRKMRLRRPHLREVRGRRIGRLQERPIGRCGVLQGALRSPLRRDGRRRVDLSSPVAPSRSAAVACRDPFAMGTERAPYSALASATPWPGSPGSLEAPSRL
jgi:hypothetical protein